jgi:hypothetical protein
VLSGVFDILRTALVGLHRQLVEIERRDYERLHGRVSDSAFLAVVVSNPDFSWLGALTTLIVHLETTPRDAGGGSAARESLTEIRKALTSGADGGEFNRKYAMLLKRDSELFSAHGAVMRELDRVELALSR